MRQLAKFMRRSNLVLTPVDHGHGFLNTPIPHLP